MEKKGWAIKNATSILMFSVAYLVFFTLFVSITGIGTGVPFSLSELFVMATVTIVAVVAVLVTASVLANTEILGSGVYGGEFIWRGGMFGIVVMWTVYISTKMIALMPSDTPLLITLLFIGPPLAGILWGMFAAFLKSGLEG